MENGLLMRINGGGSNSPTRSSYSKTEELIANHLQGGIVYALRGSFYVLSVMQLVLLILIPKN